jgi:hypothetical protein
MAKITFKVPTHEGEPAEMSGVVAMLKLDGQRVRCVIQDNGHVADYRSGYSFGSFRDRQALHYAANPYRNRMTNREAAQARLDYVVACVGVEKVKEAVAAKPALN